MPARACGTIRIARASVISTTSARTPSTISVAIWGPFLSVGDERRGAVDLHDLNSGAGLERVIVVVGARGPDFPAYLHAATVGVNALDHGGRPADERRRAGADPGRSTQMAPRDRPQ